MSHLCKHRMVSSISEPDLRGIRNTNSAQGADVISANDHLKTMTQDWDGNLGAKKQPYKLPFLSEL